MQEITPPLYITEWLRSFLDAVIVNTISQCLLFIFHSVDKKISVFIDTNRNANRVNEFSNFLPPVYLSCVT